MDSVPSIFIERVAGILSSKTLNVLREGEATLGQWVSAHPTYKRLELYIIMRDDFQPISDNHFNAFKKMIARQRRRMDYFFLGSKTEELMDDVAEILGVCGGLEKLCTFRNIAPIAPIVKKLISDGGVHEISMYHKSYPDWLVPTLAAQVQVGNLTEISLYVGIEDDELYESLIRMAVNHILQQEH
uniref:TIR domain-containing protein n=1 Tax=Steinernema glaseri TaxID=37863 RepID=A0A1I7Y0Q2_9BILA